MSSNLLITFLIHILTSFSFIFLILLIPMCYCMCILCHCFMRLGLWTAQLVYCSWVAYVSLVELSLNITFKEKYQNLMDSLSLCVSSLCHEPLRQYMIKLMINKPVTLVRLRIRSILLVQSH